jgi:hypothetical protein
VLEVVVAVVVVFSVVEVAVVVAIVVVVVLVLIALVVVAAVVVVIVVVSQRISHSQCNIRVQGASKKFDEWYQEKKKKEDTNKSTILAFKMILILHNTLLATFIKASGKCQEWPH